MIAAIGRVVSRFEMAAPQAPFGHARQVIRKLVLRIGTRLRSYLSDYERRWVTSPH